MILNGDWTINNAYSTDAAGTVVMRMHLSEKIIKTIRLTLKLYP